MEEQLLTFKELEFVVNKAKFSMLNNPGFIAQMNNTNNFLGIFSISPNKKLIFINGNEHTGLEHINLRHRYYTNEHNFFPANSTFKIANRFDKDSGKLFDYIKIAEIAYDVSNLLMKENKHPDKFDLYEAVVQAEKYRLLLYKNTKIVHTMFPTNPKHTKRVERKYKKGDVITEYQEKSFARLLIPYLDINNQIHYGIGVIICLESKTIKWHILIYKNNNLFQKAKVLEKEFDSSFDINTITMQINYMDVSSIEKIIYDVDKKNSES